MTSKTQKLVNLSILYFSLTFPAFSADWPMYRMDPARSGYSAEAVPNRLSLRWTYRFDQAPKPAWPTSERMNFDSVFEPIIVSNLVITASSADDRVYAFDLDTGSIRWSYFTEGPVRFAPTAWKDRVFVGSDDGFLYALSIADGKLLWKLQGGTGNEKVLGNERIISRHPIRGGSIVLDDKLYFSAGIWPSDGIYILAVNPIDGQIIWKNDNSGGLLMPQPHPTANAVSGVSAQGYLVADKSRLFVPTGRAIPAVFDRENGSFLYYELQKYGQLGNSRAMVAGDVLFNSGCLFDTESGALQRQIGFGPEVAIPNRLVKASGRSIITYAWKQKTKTDRKGEQVTYNDLELEKQIDRERDVLEFIVTGMEAICGEQDRVSIVDFKGQASTYWDHKVEGAALGLAFGNRRLVVSTDKGFLYCFDNEGVMHTATNLPAKEPEERKSDINYAEAAAEILKKSGVDSGYCVDLGSGTGELALELAKKSGLTIYAVESDPAKVETARRKIAKAGLYGGRVIVHSGSPGETGYPKYFANLVVSSAGLAGDLPAPVMKEAKRIQRPYGGVLCIGKTGTLNAEHRGSLNGAGNWTHLYANAANTTCSDDTLVKGRLRMHWFRDVEFELSNRHGQGPAPVYNKGIMIVGGVNGLRAMDAYNGRLLWHYDIPLFLKDYDGIHHDVGIGETGGVYCMDDDYVYAKSRNDCHQIDINTGKLVRKISTPTVESDSNRDWGYIACEDGILFGSVANEEHTTSPRYSNIRLWTESVLLFAIDTKTGALLWKFKPEHSIRHNAVTAGGDTLYLIDRPIALQDRIKATRRDGRPGPKMKEYEQPAGVLVALDVRTGKEKWRQAEDIYGTQLELSRKHNILLMHYQGVRHNFFSLPSEAGGRISAIDAVTGKRLWDQTTILQSEPIINDSTIYAHGGAWNLLTGEKTGFELERSYGCGQITASANMLFFRSATLGYRDLSREAGTENFGGMRPGCYMNVIPAGGLVLIPDSTYKCRCSYQIMRVWLALQGD